MDNKNHRVLTAAKFYHALGFNVLPVGKDKRPTGKWLNWTVDKQSPEQIAEWFTNKHTDIAVITGKISGISVLDIDDPTTPIAKELMAAARHMVSTPSGGRHIYYRYTPVSNKVGVVPGMDIRSDGGYVVAPPSEITTGHYKWERWKNLSEGLGELLEFPQHILMAADVKTTISEESFNQGKRDDSLFHAALAMLRGGMKEEEAQEAICHMAKNCNPPFSKQDALVKVRSAREYLLRQSNASISENVRTFIEEAGVGIFSTLDIYNALSIVRPEDKAAVRAALQRGITNKTIERVTEAVGKFRVVDSEVDRINLDVSEEYVPLRLPLELDTLFKAMPKNIIVVAGAPDAGKTALLLNIAQMNYGGGLPIRYSSSEMGPAELKSRINKFEIPFDFNKVEFIARSSNFEDIILKDGINIIDFLEVSDEFYRVGGMIKNVFDKLNKGVAIIALQKNRGLDLGLGGHRGLEKPRLYLAMDSGRIKIIKCKNWAQEGVNPNGLIRNFYIVGGCNFIPSNGWYRPETEKEDITS